MIAWIAAQHPAVGAAIGYSFFIILLVIIVLVDDLPKQRAYRRRVAAENAMKAHTDQAIALTQESS